MRFRTLIMTFLFVYFLVSLPAVFGIGYEIDWIPEASFVQKLKAYTVEVLFLNFVEKSLLSLIVSIATFTGLSIKKSIS